MEFDGQYLTYNEYTNLGGSLSENAFKLLEFKARKEIDKCTFERLISLVEQRQEVKLCIFELISILNENKSSIKSEGVDGYSITLMDKKELEKVVKGIIEDYLSECKLDDDYNTPYLYAGDETKDHHRSYTW